MFVKHRFFTLRDKSLGESIYYCSPIFCLEGWKYWQNCSNSFKPWRIQNIKEFNILYNIIQNIIQVIGANESHVSHNLDPNQRKDLLEHNVQFFLKVFYQHEYKIGK